MRRFQFALLALFVAGCLNGCGGGSANGGSGFGGTPTPTPPSAPTGSAEMFVLNPVSGTASNTSAVQTYLMNNNPVVTGAAFQLNWSDAETSQGVYDFSVWENKISPWITAGKKVSLIVWAVSDPPVNASTPQYVLTSLGPTNTTTCNGEVIPNYFSTTFQSDYQAFMSAVVAHYSGNSSVAYIRFGLGQGGETYPGLGFGSDPICQAFFTSLGFTSADPSLWLNNYLIPMLNYEGSLKSSTQLMVGINQVDGLTVPDTVAATAVANKIAFGSQGLQASDITNFSAGLPCTVDWCALFQQYTGQVALELQTLGESDPAGVTASSPAGSLVPLLPFAVNHYATILEIYYQDWLKAYDPNYPGYTSQYAPVFSATSSGGN